MVASIPPKFFTERKHAVADLGRLNSGYSILIAEDNKLNQRLILAYLKGIHLDATVVGNGELALEELKQKAYDLLLLDMQMPVMDEEETIAAIRNDPELKDLYVIVITPFSRKSRTWYVTPRSPSTTRGWTS